MRDLKRYLHLIRSIAWIHQRNRRIEMVDDYTVLYAEPEDVYNAYMIGAEIFNQSYAQLDTRSKETLSALYKLVEKRGIENPELQEEEEEYKRILWIERIDLQKELKLKSAITLKKRLSPLKNLGLVNTKDSKKGNKAFVSFNIDLKDAKVIVDSPINACYLPSISPEKQDNFLSYDAKELYKEMRGKYRANIGQIQGVKTCLLSIKDDIPYIEINNNVEKDVKTGTKDNVLPIHLEKHIGQSDTDTQTEVT